MTLFLSVYFEMGYDSKIEVANLKDLNAQISSHIGDGTVRRYNISSFDNQVLIQTDEDLFAQVQNPNKRTKIRVYLHENGVFHTPLEISANNIPKS